MSDVVELTPLGKRLEMLRIERGVSKQRLARRANTSRQQLWRVMTGKCELTPALGERLALALSVDRATLLHPDRGGVESLATSASARGGMAWTSVATTAEFLADPGHLSAVVRTLPGGDGGRRLKRALLNAVEDLAFDSGHLLAPEYSEIRRRVLAGEL